MEMSIEEAINHLGNYSSTNGSGLTTDKQHNEAKRVAIDTMRKYQELEQELTNLGVDCISRVRAIERLKLNLPISQGADNSRDRHRYMQALADIQAIRELPSVTPQEPQSFKWCTNCKEYDQEKHCCHRWSKVIRDTVEEMKKEYIEREVLDKIREQIKDYLRGVEITLEVLVENDPLRPKMEGAKDTLEECLNLIDKAESEDKK